MEGIRASLPFLFILALAHQTIGLKCNAGCVGNSGNLIKYQPGTVYQYELEGTSVMSLAGAEGDAAKMVVKASADVAALPNCAFSISLTNFQVTDKDGKSVAGDKGKPVIFSMNNGVVTSDVCSAKDEPIDSMNIKRAIISLLQSSSDADHKSEVDIFGTCPTDTSVFKSGSKLKVKKIKDLTSCSHRQNFMVPFTTTHYHSISNLHSVPWVSAHQKVDQDIEGQVKSVLSKEEYSMPPAAGIETGATIVITTKLTLKGTGGGASPPGGIDKERSITLGVKEPTGENQIKNTGETVKKICEGAQGEMNEDNADLYAYLTYLVQRSSKASLLTLFNQAKQGQFCADKETAKDVVLDAIYDSHSEGGIEAMMELLKKKEVSGIKAVQWFVSLGNVRHATIQTLKAAASLLDSDSRAEAYLGAGNLIGRYCRSHNCDNVPEVNQLEKKLSAPLSKGCKPSTIKEEDDLIVSLKGLGNSGYLGAPVAKQVIQCASDHTVRSRVRSAALEALRADPNKEIIKKAAIGILKDKNEDSELRIRAYLIIVECPCPKMAGVVKDVLNNEDSFQVGNFIVSHLRNLRASKNPDKQKAQSHFSDILAPKSYPFDIRKYSTNIEQSYMLDTINSGGTSESNIIYSQKSWIPRSVSLNLTSHLFGNSFNVLEVDVRAENVERMIERIIGPKGYLNGDANDIVADAHSMWGKFMGRAKQTFRPKRGVSQNTIDAFAKQVNMGVDAGEKDESLDISLKVLGSEIGWLPLHGDHLEQTPGETIDKGFASLDDFLNNAKNIDLDYIKHRMLVEGVVAYPTGMGVPLKLKGYISSATRVKLDGQLDIPAILRDPKNAHVKFQMIPSGAVTAAVISMMEAGGLNTGFKAFVTAHSSTGSDVTVRLLEGRGIDVKVGLPLAKQEVISIKSNVVSISDTIQGKKVKPVPFSVKREEYSGCFDQISEIVGLTFCGEVSTPWEGSRIISPAYGPSTLVARIEKEDPSLTSFHFKALYNIQQDAPQHHLEIVLDTPNSKKERRFGIVIENTINPHLAFKASLDSPLGGMKFDASAKNSAAEKSINAELSLGGGEDYMFKAGLKQAGGDKYKPFLEYRAPEKAKSRFTAISGARQAQQISVSGDVRVSGKKLIFEGVKVLVGRQEYAVDGSVWDEGKNMGVDLKVTNPDDVITIKALRDDISPTNTKRSLQLTSEKYPDVSINAMWDLNFSHNKKATHIKSDFNVIHGPDPKSELARVTIFNSFDSRVDPKGFITELDSKNLVQYPVVNLKGKVDFHGNSRKFGYDIEGGFESYNGGSSLEVLLSPEYSVDFTGKVMDNSVAAHAKRKSAGSNKSQFTNSLELSPGGKYTLDALVTHKLDPEDVDAQLDLKITLPSDPKLIQVNAGVKDNKQLYKGDLDVKVDGRSLVSGNANVKKGAQLSGDFKLALPEYLDSHGEFKYTGKGLDGNAIFNLLKSNKKIEGKTHLIINQPQLKGTADLCLDSKCVKISTDSSYSKEKYATKLKLELPAGLVVDVNAVCEEPKGTHSTEIELTGAAGHHTKVSFSGKRHSRDGNMDIEYVTSIEDTAKSGAKPRRVEAKIVGKHIDLDAETGDGQLVVTYQTPEDEDFSFHTHLKRIPRDNKMWIHNAEIGASGSLVPSAVNVKFESEAEETFLEGELRSDGTLPTANYHLTLTVGNDLSLESQGKTSGQTATNDLNINLPQAKEGIKDFKWSTNNVIDSGLIGGRRKLKTSNTVKWDNKFIKSNLEINDEEKGVDFSADVEGDSIPKRTLTGNHHHCDLTEGGVCKTDGRLAISWEGKKADVSYNSEVDSANKQGQLHLRGTLPDGTKFDINSNGKYDVKGEKDATIRGETTANIGSNKYTSSALVEVKPSKYHLDFILDRPEGRSQFKSLNLRKSDSHWTSEYSLKWTLNGGGSMTGKNEVNFEDENNFTIMSDADSSVLNLKNFHFGAKVTPDKKLDLEIKNNGKTLAAAKASYQYSSEGSQKKVEGSGTINIDGKDYPLSYDATFNAQPEGNAIMQASVNAKAGDRSFTFTSEGKPNNFQMKRTYCKSASECSQAEFSYENKHIGPLSYEQNYMHKMDFSTFNPELKDLSISSKIKRDGLIFDHNIDVIWGDSKFKYVTFIHPNKAGTSLSLPQRTLAAEASYGFPKKDKYAVKFEGNVWLDKAKAPNKKALVLLTAEVGQNKDAYTGQVEARLNSPGLPKPMIIKGKGMVSNQYVKPAGESMFEIDIFKKPQMKIVGNWKLGVKESNKGYDATNIVNIKSDGLKYNIVWDIKSSLTKENFVWNEKLSYTTAKGKVKELIAKLDVNSKNVHGVLKTPDTNIAEYLLKWDIGESTFNINEELDILGHKFTEHFDAALKPLQANYKFDMGCGKDLKYAAIYEMGKAAQLDGTFGGRSYVTGTISLAEGDFLTPSAKFDTSVSSDIKECFKVSEKHLNEEMLKFLKKIMPDINEEQQTRHHLLSEAIPTFEDVAKFYQGELEKIQNEILSEKTLQGTLSVIKESLSVLLENSAQMIEQLQGLYSTAASEVQQAVDVISKTIKELIPKVQKSFEDLLRAAVNLTDDFLQMLVEMSDLVLQEITAHNDDINALMKTIGDIVSDYGKIFAKFLYQINHMTQEFAESTIAKLKELPIKEIIDEQIELIKAFFESNDPGIDQGMIAELLQDVLKMLEDVINQVRDTKNFPELEQLIETIRTWIKKALVDKEPVDNVEYTKRVGKELISLLKHLMSMVDEQVSAGEDALGKSKLPAVSPLPLSRIPPGLLRISGLSWLFSSDLPSIIQVISTYWPALNPDDWLPPFQGRAYVIGGSEVITFDGKHISVEGDCNYILTQDYIDGNFSVVGSFRGGKLDALQVTVGPDTVELRHAKKPLLNGKESEFPIFQGQIRSWKRSSTIALSTKSGLKILCDPECIRCKIRLNGFYFGRVRGILGTYNYEQFDDVVLPSGLLADSADKFLSAWSVGGGCSASSPKAAKKEATCTTTFTNAPNFLACYHLVSPKPYRDSCDRLASKETTPEGLQAAVCNVALAYSQECQNKIPTTVPPSCLKCTDSQTNVFQTTATVDPPFKKADVVFTVERYDTNKEVFENLIKPLVQTIKSELANKGISDVKFGLVGFGGKRLWPAYHTNNLEILSDDIETGNLAFEARPGRSEINDFSSTARAEAGVTGKSTTYLDLAEFYPWRLGSTKVVLGVHATRCKKSYSLFALQHLYYITSYLNKGISFHTISPVYVDEGAIKDVIAIGSDEIFRVKDAGKSSLKGQGDKDSTLSYKEDVCFTFAHMTGGRIYPSNNYKEGGAAEKEAFKKLITTSLVESLTSTSSQHAQKCTCHLKANPYDGIFAQPDCRTINI